MSGREQEVQRKSSGGCVMNLVFSYDLGQLMSGSLTFLSYSVGTVTVLPQRSWGIINIMHVKVLSSQFSSIQLLSRFRLFATPWIAARQAPSSITNSWSSLKLMCIELVMPSSHLILCHPLILLPSIPPSIRVFSNESALYMRWPKYWSFSFSISCRLCINSKEENSLVVHWLRLCTFTA